MSRKKASKSVKGRHAKKGVSKKKKNKPATSSEATMVDEQTTDDGAKVYTSKRNLLGLDDEGSEADEQTSSVPQTDPVSIDDPVEFEEPHLIDGIVPDPENIRTAKRDLLGLDDPEGDDDADASSEFDYATASDAVTPGAAASETAAETAVETPAEPVVDEDPAPPVPTLDAGDVADPVPLSPSKSEDSGRRRLRNMSEIRHYFRTNRAPVFFVGPAAFNLLGLDRWVRGFSYIAYYDSWVGAHPRVFSPIEKPYIEFESGDEINNWLLRNHEVRAYIARRTPAGVRPKIAMVFFDQETEAICRELGYDLIMPSADLREHLDSKIITTQIANEAGVPSVPNVLTTVHNWDDVVKVCEENGLGTDLVVQTAYGDSGKTTFFVTNQEEFDEIGESVLGEPIKIMKRINNRPIAVEAVLTRHGAVVGPCMTEITGYEDLTPYRGGWAGNEMYPDVLDEAGRHRAIELVRKLGERMKEEGYRGFFEVDLLLDTDSGDLYLGELNPRISGASAITNVTAGAYADVPLFVFHLLEYSDVDFDLDVDEVNDRWERLAREDEWSHMIIKQTTDTVEYINSAPPTGRYVIDVHGRLVFSQGDLDWHQLHNENEAFFLRIYGPGDYRWKGADLGILVTRGHLQTADHDLSIRARHLIQSVRSMYVATPIGADDEKK